MNKTKLLMSEIGKSTSIHYVPDLLVAQAILQSELLSVN